MSQVVLVVELSIAEGRMTDFLRRAGEHATACLAEEPGCLRFDVLRPEEGGDRVFLYEVYADAGAVETHLATPRMAKYLEDTAVMITHRNRTRCTLLNA